LTTEEIQTGSTYRDEITGFEGLCTGRCQYISGCDQALLQPPVKDGKFEDARWFDVQRLVAVDGGRKIQLDNGKTPGADRPAPVR
jgi:hypothetical protein